MTDLSELDRLLETQPLAKPTLAGEPTPRKCRRHVWRTSGLLADDLGREEAVSYCIRCKVVKDEVRSRRGRTARKRGNSLQAKAAKAAGIANIGALGLPEDAGTSRDWLVLQVKSGMGYPKNLDRWLRALTVTADQLRAVVYVETPGPGRRAKRLIVMDYGEFLDWFGPGR